MLNKTTVSVNESRQAITIGFLPLIDCAPVVVAHELGYYKEFDLNVVLSREIGWASVREKIIYGELQASLGVAGLAHAATFGFGSVVCPCVAPMIVDGNANAITLSNALHAEGVSDGKTLRAYIARKASKQLLTFGVVHPFASHNFLLRKWLQSHGINPDLQVRIVVVPPSQMCQNLKAGHLDGYCVGEPFNSLAVENNFGWTVALSRDIDPDHPDKILIMRRDFAEQNEEIVKRLIAAVLKGCLFCSKPKNANTVAQLLSAPHYLNQLSDYLLPSLTGHYNYGHNRRESVTPFVSFYGEYTNEPSLDKERWVLQHMSDNGVISVPPAIIQSKRGVIFRPDLFQRGFALLQSDKRTIPLAP